MKRRRRNPAPSDLSSTQLVAGGLASVVLVGSGVAMLYLAFRGQADTETTLADTSSLATVAALVPL